MMEQFDKLLAALAANPRVFAVAFLLTMIGALPPVIAFIRLVVRASLDLWHRRFISALSAWDDRIKIEAAADSKDLHAQQLKAIDQISLSIVPVMSIILYVIIGSSLIIKYTVYYRIYNSFMVVGIIYHVIASMNVILLFTSRVRYYLYRHYIKEADKPSL